MKRVGWWHFELTVPNDWDIAAQGASHQTEVFSLADKYSVRLEVKLEKVPLRKAKGLEELLEGYQRVWERRLKELAKSSGQQLELKHTHKEEVTICGHRGVFWVFRVARAPMSAAIWYCEWSERVVALTFTPRTIGEETFLRELLPGVKCHYSFSGERALWSTLLYDIHLPQKYRLLLAKFTALSSYCVFCDQEGREYVIVGYSGLTSFIGGKFKGGVKDWFERELLKVSSKLREQLPRVKFSREGEHAIKVRGVSRVLLRPSRVAVGRAWYDEKIDRYVAALAHFPAAKEQEAQALLADLVEQLKTPKV